MRCCLAMCCVLEQCVGEAPRQAKACRRVCVLVEFGGVETGGVVGDWWASLTRSLLLTTCGSRGVGL